MKEKLTIMKFVKLVSGDERATYFINIEKILYIKVASNNPDMSVVYISDTSYKIVKGSPEEIIALINTDGGNN